MYEVYFLNKYLNFCYAKNLSEKTIKSYEITLIKLLLYIQDKNINDINEVDADIINGYLKHKSNDVSKNTLKNYYTAIRAYFNWLLRKKIITDNPFNYLSAPKVPKRKKITFKNSEIQKIMNFDMSTFFGVRNYAIMAYLFGTGARVNEISNLKLGDIDLDSETINIIGKGDKQRYIPLNDILINITIKYIKKREAYLAAHNLKSKYVFISRTGKRLQPNNIQDIFRAIKKKHNIDKKRFSPHTFRHTFATNFLVNGGDVFSLQKLLGHSNLNTTKEYIDLDDRLIKAQNNKFNPLTNKKWIYIE